MYSDTAIKALMDAIEWRAVPMPDRESLGLVGDAPYATHEGELRIGNNAPIRCYQLSDGSRIMDSDDVHAFFSTAV